MGTAHRTADARAEPAGTLVVLDSHRWNSGAAPRDDAVAGPVAVAARSRPSRIVLVMGQQCSDAGSRSRPRNREKDTGHAHRSDIRSSSAAVPIADLAFLLDPQVRV